MDKILHGDSLELLKDLDDNSVDSIVTDPPYGYDFMGKDWDKAVPSVELWEQCLRVLKPGSFAFIMSAPRSDVQGEMIKRLEKSGFRVDFTPIYWTYATGFPKAMNIRKTVDKRGENSEQLDGSYAGYQPKPAVEVIIVVMKPMTEKSYADQALKNGKGITWLDDVRIPLANDNTPPIKKKTNRKPREENTVFKQSGFKSENNDTAEANPNGRFAANLLVQDDVLNDGTISKSVRRNPGNNKDNPDQLLYTPDKAIYSDKNTHDDEGSFSRYYDLDKWWEKRIQQLPLNVQATYPFMIVPKAGKAEKNKGLERNIHPTVKPISLMSYLVTLGSRKDELVLDPFVGSGTTCIAANLLDRKYLGMEMDDEYVVIAEERIKASKKGKIKHDFF